MDEKSILQFCKERNVEISTRYDSYMDCFIIRIRRKQNIIERAIGYLEFANMAFNLRIKSLIRDMADELDRAEKGK